MTINFPPLWKLINVPFIPLWTDPNPIKILWGSRDSSKTNYTAKYLIYSCVNDKYFRCILARLKAEWVAESQWLTIKDEVEDMGLSSIFHFTVKPLKITCLINGNMFLCRGASDVNSIKSVKDPTHLWCEEDIVYIPERDYIIISQSLRSSKVKNCQQIFTINPEIKGQDYEENWFWQHYWGEKHKDELSFKDYHESTIKVYDPISDEHVDKKFRTNYTVHHSTYKHNRWCPPERRAQHEGLRKRDPHWYKIFTLGLWGNKSADGLFYNTFDRGRQIARCEYDKNRALHITFDFNVRPYVSLGIWQYYTDREQNPELWDRITDIQGSFETLLVKIDEIAAKEPRNRTKYACEDFLKEYRNHDEGLFLYGDPAGKHEDTRSEKGSDDFNIILKELKEMNPQKRVHTAAPSVVKRGEFICSIFAENAYKVAIAFDPICKHSIIDYTSGQADADGKKFKKKVRDSVDEPVYEKYHHFSDGDDYFITKLLFNEFKSFLRGGKAYNYDAVENDRFTYI